MLSINSKNIAPSSWKNRQIFVHLNTDEFCKTNISNISFGLITNPKITGNNTFQIVNSTDLGINYLGIKSNHWIIQID